MLPVSIEQQDTAAPKQRRSVWRWAGTLGMVLALLFIGRQLVLNFSALPPLELTGAVVLHLLVASLAYLGNLILGVVNWRLLLGRGARFRRLAVIFAYSLVAKYLPGNVFQYVFGVAVGKRLGIAPASMVGAMAAEMLLAIVAAVTVGAIALAYGSSFQVVIGVFQQASGTLRVVAGVLLVAAAIAVVYLARFKHPTFIKKLWDSLRSIPAGSLALVFGLLGLQFLLGGVCLREMALLWAPDAGRVLPPAFILGGGFALAWVGGMLVPGAPGGLGVREAILLGLFAPVLGTPLSLATFVSTRIVMVGIEIAAFVPAPLLLRRVERQATSSP